MHAYVVGDMSIRDPVNFNWQHHVDEYIILWSVTIAACKWWTRTDDCSHESNFERSHVIRVWLVCDSCVTRVRLVCDSCATRVRLVCDSCATRVRLVCDSCATRVRLVCDSCATRVRLVCDSCATRVRLVCDSCATRVRLVCDSFATRVRLVCDSCVQFQQCTIIIPEQFRLVHACHGAHLCGGRIVLGAMLSTRQTCVWGRLVHRPDLTAKSAWLNWICATTIYRKRCLYFHA